MLAAAAFVLLNESFEPFSAQLTLQGHDSSQTFNLTAREPLFLEYEVVVRSSAASDRPLLAVTVNDQPVAVPAVTATFFTEHTNVAVPVAALRDGANVLRVRVGGAESNRFDMHARLHNYYGIAPNFPRAAIVSDEAAAARFARASMTDRAVRLLVLIIWSVGAVWVLGFVGTRSERWRRARVLAMLVGPVAAVLYGVGRPLHLWLSPPALIVLAIVPGLFVELIAFVMRRRRVALAFGAPVVVTLVLLEGALRIYDTYWPTYVFYSDSSDRFRGKPGDRHYDDVFNSRGFNDVEHSLNRPSNVAYRIVALGDSFAVGVVPQRDNFLSRLGPLISSKADLKGRPPPSERTVEVVNMGVSGAQPRDYLSILADEGLAYSPDLVLVNFFIGNDFETRSPRWYERSYLTTLTRALWRLGRAQSPVVVPGGNQGAYDDNTPTMNDDLFMEVQVDRSWVYERGSPRLSEAVARVAGSIRQMRDLARRSGANILVALIPDETQVNSDVRARVAAARGLSAEQFETQQPNQLLTQALADEDIRVLDLLPALSEAAMRERVYKPADTHWNLAGNRVAAETIAGVIVEWVASKGRP